MKDRKYIKVLIITMIMFVTSITKLASFFKMLLKNKHNYKKEYIEEHKDSQKDNLVPLLLPSILSIFICLICLCSATWAWFTTNINIENATIKAANYGVDVEVKLEEIVEPVKTLEYLLNTGTYTVTLTSNGNATTGYNKIKIDDKELYTEQLYTNSKDGKKQKITFTIVIEDEEEHNVSFIPVWGTYSGNNIEIYDGTTYKIANKSSSIDSDKTDSSGSNSDKTASSDSDSETPVLVEIDENSDVLSIDEIPLEENLEPVYSE